MDFAMHLMYQTLVAGRLRRVHPIRLVVSATTGTGRRRNADTDRGHTEVSFNRTEVFVRLSFYS